MTDIAALRSYLERYFVSFTELSRLGAVSGGRLDALIAAGAVPGPIYSLWRNGAFWSAIGGAHGPAPEGEPVHCYAPAAAWWLRRSNALPPQEAAKVFEARFVADFTSRLAAEPSGPLGYPLAYDAGQLDPSAAAIAGAAEWRDWIGGGYGVCLRQANALHAITKTCRRAMIIEITDEGRASALSGEQREHLLDAMEELDAVMLPFAPHQRPHGTPGLWLDAMLERYGLGSTRESERRSDAPTPDRHCA